MPAGADFCPSSSTRRKEAESSSYKRTHFSVLEDLPAMPIQVWRIDSCHEAVDLSEVRRFKPAGLCSRDKYQTRRHCAVKGGRACRLAAISRNSWRLCKTFQPKGSSRRSEKPRPIRAGRGHLWRIRLSDFSFCMTKRQSNCLGMLMELSRLLSSFRLLCLLNPGNRKTTDFYVGQHFFLYQKLGGY